METTVTPLPPHADPGREIPQDRRPQDVGRENKGIEEQPVEQEEVQPLERQPDHNSADPQEDFEERNHVPNPHQVGHFGGIYLALSH